MGIVARQSIKGTLATYFGVAVGIVTTFFVQTKYLTTEEIGLVDVLLQSALLFSGLAQLGTNTSAMRYYPYFKDEEHRDHGFFGWTLIVPLVGFILFLGGFFALRNPIASFFSEKSALFIDYIYYVIPLAFFMLYILVFETNSNLLMRIVVPRFIREVGLRVMTLVIYLLYGFHVLSLTGMVVAFCVSYGLATVINIVYLFTLHRVSFRIEKKYITPKLKRDFLIYTVFLITSALAGNITPLLNRYFVAGKQGLAISGILTIAIYIATLVEMPYRSLGSISKPQISQAMADGNVKEADRICKSVALHQFLAGSLVFFFIWINIDTVFALLPNGEVFAAGKWAVLILGLSRLVNSTLNVGTTVLSYSKIYYYSLFFTILLTVLAWWLNARWVVEWGVNGAAFATLVAYMVHYVLLLALIRWKIGTSPLSAKQLLVLLVVGVLFGLDWLWSKALTPWFVGLFSKPVYGLTVDSLLKTTLFLVIGLVTIYKIKISQSVNDVIDKGLQLLGLKRK
ncbi:MAG: oligosaccharide flippase family protein [Bacteroidales bacterium]|nr:oligosaccharide flippase family protein [Bacteroidales bacterium]